MIGLPCGENGRYTDIIPAIMRLDKPPGTLFSKKTGLGPAAPLNEIGREFMSRPYLKWLFLTNDDNLCPQNTIPTLWNARMSVITGLYFGRTQPFEPVIFDAVTENEGHRWYKRKFMQPQDRGIIHIDACGDGCLMIHRNVLERIPYPWWQYGETLPDQCDHDMVFCRKVREAGFLLWCDTDVRVDHITSMAVRPVRNVRGEWEVHLVQGVSRSISLPALVGPGNYVNKET